MNRILYLACSDRRWGVAARASVWIGGAICSIAWIAWLIVKAVD